MYLGHDVDGAHEQLVQVSVHHHVAVVDQGIFEAGPDFPPQLRRDVQFGTQVPEPHAGQVVHLQRNGERGVQLSAMCVWVSE